MELPQFGSYLSSCHFLSIFYLYFYKKIIVLHVGEGSNLDPSPIHLAWKERLVKSSQKNLVETKMENKIN
jgi:hypothetical protein